MRVRRMGRRRLAKFLRRRFPQVPRLYRLKLSIRFTLRQYNGVGKIVEASDKFRLVYAIYPISSNPLRDFFPQYEYEIWHQVNGHY